MAGAGSPINYSNIVALDGSSWRYSTSVGGGAGTQTYYVAAPAFRIYFHIWGSGWWGYQSGSMYVYPYDSSTGAFSSNAVVGSWQSGKGSGYSYTWDWFHNAKDNSGNYGSPEDIHDCHLWKVVVMEGDNSGGSSGTLYTGGIGCTSESIYNSYFKNRKIYCSKGDYWKQGNTYSSDSAFLSAQGYSCLRGTPISVSTGTYKYVCAQKA